MLQDERSTIKVLTGRFGAGKDLIMISHALSFLEKEKYDKIIWVRNNIEVKDTAPLGALPGSNEDKLIPWCGPLIDHLGGVDGVRNLIESGQLEVVHLGHLRGRDFKRSIIISSEAENLTKQHLQLLIGRVGEGSNLWINGDWKQRDKKIFEESLGLEGMIQKLSGNPLFGYVHLTKSERSETAALADLLD